jgi:MraZ protein
VFQGAAALNMDAKGRIAVPTRHRDALTRDAGKMVLTGHPEGCLLLYPAPAWEPIRTKVMGFPSLDPLASRWKRVLVGFAEEIELDGAGRMLVSPELRNFARLDKRVMMVGQGSHFELWAVDAWEQQLAALAAQPGQGLPPGMEDFAL